MSELLAWGVLAVCVWLATSTGGRANAPQPAAVATVAADARCVACGGPANGNAKLHVGRPVPICSEPCAEHFALHTDELFARFQVRGALFDETSTVARNSAAIGRSLFSGWFWFGCYVVIGLIGSAWSAYLALSKGLEPLPWLWRGLAFNLVAVVIVALKPAIAGAAAGEAGAVPAGLAKIPLTSSPIACPQCGGPNHPSARRCVACGRALKAAGESESVRAMKSKGP